MNIPEFEEFISQYPIYEYRVIDTDSICIRDRVRMICEECPRYNSTWACPPAVGELEECGRRIHSYRKAIIFSSVSEVTDLMNMDELLSYRGAHEELTTHVGDYMREKGYDIFILSTESCDICDRCAWLDGEPCRFPDRMHPCIESHGVVVSEIVEQEQMDYDLGGNTILWFSLILFNET